MSKSFFENFSTIIDAEKIEVRDGLSYLSAATAVAMAGRPEIEFVEFGNLPYLSMLGGAVVAVDLKVPGTSSVQRTYLPVLDEKQAPVPLKSLKASDINNARQRALVKALACVHGVGMSLYMGYDGHGAEAAQDLGVTPDSALDSVTPVVSILKSSDSRYIEWGVASAAARITDETFYWNVVEWDDNLPFRSVLGSVMVDVETVYRGKRQRLSLPLYDSAFKPVPYASATVADWNKTVMRALTKCLAFNAGYGLSVYAGEEFDVKRPKSAKNEEIKPQKAVPAVEVKTSSATFPPIDAEQGVPKAINPARNEVPADESQLVALNQEVETAKSEPKEVAQAPDEAVYNPTAVAQATTEVQAEITPTQEPNPGIPNEVSQEQAEPETAMQVVVDEDAEKVAETTQRFNEVMRKRFNEKGVPGLVSLYPAVKASTKFSDSEKPLCYQLLTNGIASAFKTTLPAAELNELLMAIRDYNGISYLPAEIREVACAKLVRRSIESALEDSNDLVSKNVLNDLIAAQIAKDVDDLIHLAKNGRVSTETIEYLLSLT